MFAEKNVGDELKRRRKLSVFTHNVAALLALLVVGFPVTPATIRATVASWAIFTIASLQFVLRRIGPLARLAPITTIRERLSGLNQKA